MAIIEGIPHFQTNPYVNQLKTASESPALAAICHGPRRTGALQLAGLRPVTGRASKVPKAGDAVASEPPRSNG